MAWHRDALEVCDLGSGLALGGAWYVQCRYGARVLFIDGKNNAVFVKKLEEVAGVLDAFKAAAQAGELDAAIAKATERKTKAAE